jgi:hypothetical protein
MTPRDKIMGDIFKSLKLDLWDAWDDAFRKAKLKGETDGYAAFLADAWMNYRSDHTSELMARLT